MIAQRVRGLREAARLSGAGLADRMVVLGVPWNRTTVAKLETGRRSSVTVQELLALALALDVPPVVLIADPRHRDVVPVADGLTVDAWDALLWLAGTAQVRRYDLDNYEPATWMIHAGIGVLEALAELDKRERYDTHPTEEAAQRARQRDDDRHRDALGKLRVCLVRIREQGAPPPPMVSGAVYERARELGVNLPGEREVS